MLHKLFILVFSCCSLAVIYSAENKPLSITAEFNLKGAGAGVCYQLNDRLHTQAIAGISSNFTEKKWNDFFIQSKTQYQVLKGKHLALPLGLLLGGRAVHNYDNTYGVFYFGAYTGLDYTINKRNMINLDCGYKYGQNRYEISHTSAYGTTSYIEKYKEQPFILSIAYSLAIH